jgi:polygalacturonase
MIDAGAVLIAAEVKAENDYDAEEPGPGNEYQDYGHSHFHNSLIWGDSIHDVTISGSGRIWGKGLYRGGAKGAKQSANKSIALVRCRNVIIRDISILHGGWFAILATGVDNFTLDNVRMDTNRDGVDVDCCKNVRISNCTVNSPYDDAICLKSTYALGMARSTENVTITNCQVSGYDEGTLLDGTFQRTKNPKYGFVPTGRIKMGTESNGGFKNVTISNCVFDYCEGLALESVDGAQLEDVTITNITMRDMVEEPIFLRLGSRMRGPAGTPVGALRRVKISNIVAYNCTAENTCTISGIPGHDIEDIQLSNIIIYYSGGPRVETSNEPDMPENEGKYPEPGMFGPCPVYGFYIRHAKHISIRDLSVYTIKADARPAFEFNDVKGLDADHIGTQDAVLKSVTDYTRK